MGKKILSVSIAAYNVASTLEEALIPFTDEKIRDSVDVMIVDDGSKDETAEIALRYEKAFPGTFRLLTKENGGWGSTLNVGMKNACGKYFKQLDGDDYYSQENLEDFLKFLGETDADLVYSPFVTFDDATGGIIRILGAYSGYYSFFPLNKTIPLSECDNFIPAMHALTVKTDVLQENKISIMEHCFYTDVEYVLKTYNMCRTVTFFEKPIYYYRLARNGQSMSQTGVRKHYNDHQRMLMSMIEYYQKKVTNEHTKKIFEKRLLEVCNMQYIFYFALKSTPKHKRELRNFDRVLKQNYPLFYNQINGRQVSLLRKTSFWGYSLVSWQKMKKDKRLKQNIFEGV